MNRDRTATNGLERPWLETSREKVRLIVIAALVGAVVMLPIALFATTDPGDWRVRLVLLVPGALAGGLFGLIVANMPAGQAAPVGIALARVGGFLIGMGIADIVLRLALPSGANEWLYQLIGIVVGGLGAYEAGPLASKHAALIKRVLLGPRE